MAYIHVTVADLVEPAGEAVTTRNDADNEFWVDGFPVHREIYNFCVALRRDRAFRNVKFAARSLSSGGLKSKLYAYFPNQLYTLGHVFYGDNGLHDKYHVTYRICGRGVKNRTYHYTREAYNWLLTTNVDTAVRKAKGAFRPYTSNEILTLSASNFTEAAASAAREYQRSRRHSFEAMAEDITDPKSKLFSELEHLVKSGHEFVTDGVRELIEDALAKREAMMEASADTKPVSAVIYKPPAYAGAPKMVDVIHLGSMGLNNASSIY